MRLYKATLKLLESRSRSITIDNIVEATGLSRSWIEKFASSSPPINPSVNKVEKLYVFLSGREIIDEPEQYTGRTKELQSLGELEIRNTERKNNKDFNKS